MNCINSITLLLLVSVNIDIVIIELHIFYNN